MAAPTNAFATAAAIGNRESLHDAIYTLKKDDTPLQTIIGSGTANATYEEWQLDNIGNATTTNYQAEGTDIVGLAITPTVRVGNRTQVMTKPYTITDTQEAVRKAGRESEVGYQGAMAARRIKIDLEASISQNVASTGTDPRRLGGAETWLTTNVARGTTGASGGFTAGNTVAPTDSSITRAPTLALLKGVMKTAWDAGGTPNWLLMGSGIKMAFSTFVGIATLFTDSGKPTTLTGTVDRFRSDFGTFNAAMSRYVRGREILVIDPSLWRLLWLQKWKKEQLARTGLSRKFVISGEVTLECRNEAGSGIVADLAA